MSEDPEIYRFGEFELEPRERRLRRFGQPLALTPKAFDMLVLLVRHAGHIQSKDELMSALWPRGFVDEATLTNHVWQIRRALGDTAKTPQYVETVPKRGYRFLAEVSRDPGVSPTLPPPAPIVSAPPQSTAEPVAAALLAAGPARRRSRWVAVIVGIVIAAAVGTVGLLRHAATERPVVAARVIALVAFDNLSKVEQDAWLEPALLAMLGSELGAARRVRIIPSSLVHDAARRLAPPLAGGYSRESLEVLRQRLEADYVVSGSYLIGNGPDDPKLRIDVALQSTASGEVVASLWSEAPASDLTSLVASLGAQLRSKLDGSAVGEKSIGAPSQPTSPELARHMGIAIDALQRHDPAQARDELLEAIAQAPGFAGAYLNLSRAWSALGFRRKALAAADQASARASTLSPIERLEVKAAVQQAGYEWDQAADTWRVLAQLNPESLEYRLSWVDAAIAAGETDIADRVIGSARHLPHADSDPRIELAAARLADTLSDPRQGVAHASTALRESQAHDLPGLAADAQIAVAISSVHLGDLATARAAAADALAAYRQLGNRMGEASAHRVLGSSEEPQRAREDYQRAMTLAQGTGDMGTVGNVYRDLSEMLWLAGDRDGAQAAARQGLAISRDTGDLHLQAWTLRALATIAADDAATDTVLSEYREVTELTQRSHDRGGHAWSLATNADLLRIRGELDEAESECSRAREEAGRLTDPQFSINALFICAELEADRGHRDSARSMLENVLRLARGTKDVVAQANAELEIGQLEVDQGHWLAAREHLVRAVDGFAAHEAQTGEADAQALLAVSAQATGDAAGSDRAAERATQLLRAITSRQEVYSVDILLSQLKAGTPQGTEVVRRLAAVALDAQERHWIGFSLEAKLAELRLLQADRNAGESAHRLRDELESEARSHGFGRIVDLMSAAPAAPMGPFATH